MAAPQREEPELMSRFAGSFLLLLSPLPGQPQTGCEAVHERQEEIAPPRTRLRSIGQPAQQEAELVTSLSPLRSRQRSAEAQASELGPLVVTRGWLVRGWPGTHSRLTLLPAVVVRNSPARGAAWEEFGRGKRVD